MLKPLSLKNYHLKFLANWLNTELHGKEARARVKFLKAIAPRIGEIEEKRIEKLRELSEKDENNAPKIKEGNAFDLNEENLKKFNEWMAELNKEDFTIEPEGKDTVKVIGAYVTGELGAKKSFDLTNGAVYDEVCDAFEKCK